MRFRPCLAGCAALLAATLSANAQSAGALINIAPRKGQVRTAVLTSSPDTSSTGTSGYVARNPYVGAQTGFTLGGGGFASNLVAGGSIIYVVINDSSKSARFSLPVRGNFSGLNVGSKSDADQKKISDLVSSATGLRIAVEPEVRFNSWKYFRPAVFGSAGWKLSAVKDSGDTTHYLPLGRVGGGVELGIGPASSDRLPIVIDLSAVYSSFANREYKAVGANLERSTLRYEIVVVVPVASSVGFMTEAVVGNSLPVWRMGFVFIATNN
jgi:hypothetical protein